MLKSQAVFKSLRQGCAVATNACYNLLRYHLSDQTKQDLQPNDENLVEFWTLQGKILTESIMITVFCSSNLCWTEAIADRVKAFQ